MITLGYCSSNAEIIKCLVVKSVVLVAKCFMTKSVVDVSLDCSWCFLLSANT